jgi:hypothetical protein
MGTRLGVVGWLLLSAGCADNPAFFQSDEGTDGVSAPGKADQPGAGSDPGGTSSGTEGGESGPPAQGTTSGPGETALDSGSSTGDGPGCVFGEPEVPLLPCGLPSQVADLEPGEVLIEEPFSDYACEMAFFPDETLPEGFREIGRAHV